MIEVSFHFFNILADAAGTRVVHKSVAYDTRLIDAIRLLSGDYPAAFQGMLLPNGAISNYLKIFINGRLVDNAETLTLLNEGDEIMLFPAVSGG